MLPQFGVALVFATVTPVGNAIADWYVPPVPNDQLLHGTLGSGSVDVVLSA